MKTIELNTAAVDNAGRRIEAGARVAVGPKADQIAADRAKELVGRASASTVRETAPQSAKSVKAQPKAKTPKPTTAKAAATPAVADAAPGADTAKP